MLVVSCAKFNKKQYNLVVYPGRFQPFHQGHYDMIKEAKKHGKHVLIAISQAKGMQKDERNVFSGDDREKMITNTLTEDGFTNYSIIQLDYVKKGKTIQDWDNNLIKTAKSEYRKIFKAEPNKDDIAFIYYDRDKANYDKRFEKDFDIIQVKSSFDDDISATKVRDEFFEQGFVDKKLPSGTRDFLDNFHKTITINNIEINYIENLPSNKNYPRMSAISRDKNFKDGWVQIVDTDSNWENGKWRHFVDWDPKFTKYPLYSYENFNDEPQWAVPNGHTLHWKAKTFPVRLMNDKIIAIGKGFSWGFVANGSKIKMIKPESVIADKEVLQELKIENK
ncbi:Putative bifunctional NMN adenylyltransferase/Nudix hydrolase [Candidatus Deianiraea vastatrix]|uniref:Bifunctional NMN adenylyltransferase/Nudix hydrolase n=2 Tax=Candidatus Deianiraea vastatrix TaxID=2163644 RepID=A0A5B8XJM4_9RICK|nr:Putative bifunctional NMN adenylyltransferase/Nudix hydrolase [Candidatus Deianiraea vastatrix]